jgi:hypothetical protein
MTSMKNAHILLVIGCFTVLLPIAHATTADDLLDDLNAWQDDITQQTKDQGLQDADSEFQKSADLFPDLTTLSNQKVSVLQEKRDERIADFVSVDINGATLTFSDVPRTEWFAPYVRTIAEKGLVSGYLDTAGKPTGKFGPADNVTIEQMAKVIVSAIGIPSSDCSTHTLNVTASGSWSAPYFACAEKHSWSVYSDGSVDAHRPATRAEVVATLLQANGITPDNGTGAAFTDVTSTLQYGSIIAKAKADGIVSGYTDINGNPTGLFGPNDAVTRAEFAKIVTLGLQVYGAQ